VRISGLRHWLISLTVLASMLSACGCVKLIAFGTATKFGLDISQKADQTIDVTLGYDRVEVASIPAELQDAGPGKDTYSVLSDFSVSYGNPFPPNPEPLVLTEVFTTGHAARIAAANPAFRKYFGGRAGLISKQNESVGGQPVGGQP
jgi:hypothetical protein